MVIALDLLYWHPHEDGMAFARSNSQFYEPSMEGGWGFRLAGGCSPLYIRWTCLPIQHDTECSGVLFPLWSQAPKTTGSYVEKAHAHWRLHLGLVDCDLRREFFPLSAFSFTPQLGVRFASIRQKFFVTYAGGSLFPNQQDRFHSKVKYWGIGPEMGLTLKKNLGWGVSLLARGSYSPIFGSFYIHETERKNISLEKYLSFLTRFPLSCSLVEGALGVEWRWGKFFAHLFWEEHLFPKQNRLVSFLSPSSPHAMLGDLALSGASFEIGFLF